MINNFPNDPRLSYAVIRLSDELETQKANPHPDFTNITSNKFTVLARYQPIFDPTKVKNISKETFLSFLLYKNNHHWDSLHRVGKYMTEDMELLREALSILLDEQQPISDRLNQIRPERTWGKNSMVSHLGTPVLTAILMITYPDKYGVWNNTSDNGLKEVKLWEKNWETLPSGDSYQQMNNLYHELISYLHIDLWTLDALWWVIKKPKHRLG